MKSNYEFIEDAGREAYAYGFGIGSCPYISGSSYYDAWRKGWIDADNKYDAWGWFESEFLTDGNGYAKSSTYKACYEAFSKAWPNGEQAAREAAKLIIPNS